MLIESILRRPGGTMVTIEGKAIEFKPSHDFNGKHVAEIDDESIIGKLLAIPEGYRLVKRHGLVESSTKASEKSTLGSTDHGGVDRAKLIEQYVAVIGRPPPPHTRAAAMLEAIKNAEAGTPAGV